MHELSIAQSIVDIVKGYVPDEGLARVKSVKLKIGAIAGVVPDSLEFCFDAITEETPLRDAVLEIENVPFVVKCKQCGLTSTNEGGIFLCMTCGSDDLTMISGNEMKVTEVELLDEKGVMV